MNDLRNNPIKEMNGVAISEIRDYETDTIRYVATNEIKPTGLPKSNVLYYELTDGSWVAVRPSGTEPKIKFYFGVSGETLDEAGSKLSAFSEAFMGLIQQ